MVLNRTFRRLISPIFGLLAPAVIERRELWSTSVFFWPLLLPITLWENKLGNFWYVGYFQVANGRVKIFLIWIQYARLQRRKWWCDGVGPLGRWAVRKQFVSGAYLWKYLSDCLQILHTTPLGGLVVPDLFRRFDAHFVSGADLEKYWADDSHIAHTCSLRSLVVPFQVFGPWPWSWPSTLT